MSIFAPSIYNEPSFTGLFRLLDDFDNYRAAGGSNSGSSHNNHNSITRHTHLPSFNPKFDVKETETAYELHGDLPGVEKKDVSIEFADEHTLTIRGKVGRSYSSKPEDEDQQQHNKGKGAENNNSTEVAKTSGDGDKQVGNTAAAGQPFKTKYWITERSVGEFHRSFHLAGDNIDHDGVKASLENGVLMVTVPKLPEKKNARRKIAIN